MAAAHSQGDTDPAWLTDLVGRIGRGDRRAESEFVAKFEPGVRALARRHARPNDARAADVCQDVLMHVLERLRSGALQDAAALPAYVRTAVVRGVSALYRAAASTTSADAATMDEYSLVAASETPEKRVADQESLRAVHRAMAELAVERDRELLRRFYFDERSKEQVCDELGIDAAHFRRVLFRARERLRQLLDEGTIST